MTIEDKIKQIATQHFPQYDYIYDNLYRIDERMETSKMPVIISTLPQGGVVNVRNGRIHDRENILLGFFDLVPHDADGDDNAECFNRMKNLGFAFIAKMNESGMFGYVTDFTYEVHCVRMANIVTGVFFSVQVQDLGRCD